MNFCFDDIYIKGRKLVQGGYFVLPNNGIFIISGDNGTGKTLLLNLLFQQNVKNGRNCILVDQSSDRLLINCSVIENISFSCISQDNNNAKESLISRGFGNLIEHSPKVMSGGEKRIVCILRGLYSNPKDILFIDEPTNELDIDAVDLLIEEIKELSKSILIIAISHDDRILCVADGIINVENGELSSDTICISPKPDNEKNDVNENRLPPNTKTDLPLLKKQFGVKWISLFLCVLFVLVIVLSCKTVVEAGTKRMQPMRKDQIDIFIPVSTYSLEITQSSLPISLLPFLNGESNISEFVDSIKRDNSKTRPITFNLNIPQSDKYTVYKLEYYDVYMHQNKYTAEKLCEMTGKAALNTNGLFDFSYSIHNSQADEDKITRSEFVAAENHFESASSNNENPLELVFCTVIMNDGYTLSDFYNCEEIKPLLNGNYYIRSNDTITIINDAIMFSSQKKSVFLILFSSLIVIAMECLVTEIYINLGKKQIRIFRNMAVPSSSIILNIYNAMKDDKIRRVSILCETLICLGYVCVCLKQNIEIVSLFWGYYLYSIAFILVVGLFVKIICKKKILRYVDWRFR